MAFSYSPKIVTDGLVLYLDAANPYSYVSGSTSWNDISRGGNNGTLINGPTFDSANGGSIVTDGTNDIISGSIITPTSFTCNFWFNPTQVANFNPIFSITDVFGNFVWHSTSNGSIYCGTDITSRFNPTSPGCGPGAVPVNTIQNFTYTFNANTGSLYKNGNLLTSANNHQTPISASVAQPYFVLATTSQPGRGKAYIFQIYNRALSAQEVLQNYNATKTRFGLT
jgi:hypothetical protein